MVRDVHKEVSVQFQSLKRDVSSLKNEVVLMQQQQAQGGGR